MNVSGNNQINFIKGVTVESLLHELQISNDLNNNRFCNKIQYWDEFNTLISSFGVYKAGGMAFDRSVYLTLYNGEDTHEHMIKSKNVILNRPRLSFYGAAHPQEIINCFHAEKFGEQGSDGLFARMLTYMPQPVRGRLGNFRIIINSFALL